MVDNLFIFSFNYMKNKNIQYLIYLISFIVFLDLALGKLYETAYFSKKSIQQDRLIHSAIDTKEDILIFGSSRAYHHYNPQIIEDSLGMTCYNVGYGGQNIYFHLALLESALERYKPKIAILELMSIDFEKTTPQFETEKLGVLLPFANKSEAIYNTVMLRGWAEKYKLISSIYPLNSKQLYMLLDNFTTVKSHNKGFAELTKVWNKPISEMYYKVTDLDTNKLNAMYLFADLCKKNDIRLFIFISPHFVIKSGKNQFEKVDKMLLDKYQIKINNFESDSVFLMHPEYFADPFHLNKIGSTIYTSIVARKIKSELQQIQ